MRRQSYSVTDITHIEHYRRKRQNNDAIKQECTSAAKKPTPTNFWYRCTRWFCNLPLCFRLLFNRAPPVLRLSNLAELKGFLFTSQRELLRSGAKRDPSTQRNR